MQIASFTIMKVLNLLILVFGAAILTGNAAALEEPEFNVVAVFEDFEIRRYEPYIVAEVEISGDARQADRSGFNILAGYIFGNNSAAEKMAMTAPVETSAADSSTKMAMTAPVTTSPGENGRSRYAFVMERKYTLDTLPVPNDKRIRIREIPAKTVAVRRYSGRWTEKGYAKHEAILMQALSSSNIEPVAQPILARYNSPFSIPMLRRNEVIVEIDYDAAGS